MAVPYFTDSRMPDEDSLVVRIHPSAPKWLCDMPWARANELVDPEDSIEFAGRLWACIEVFGAAYMNFGSGRDHICLVTNKNAPKKVDFSEIPGSSPVVSALDIFTEPWSPDAQEVSRYWNNHAIREGMKRRVVPFSPTDTEDDYLALDKIVESFGGTAFVKEMGRKSGTGIVKSGKNLVLDIMEKVNSGYMLPHVLIQEVVDFTWESRFFVIGGEVVTSSGRIITDNPIFDGVAFPNRAMERFSTGHNDNPTEDPFHEVKHDFARNIVRKVNECTPAESWKNYTLDIGIVNGEPCVVEVNPLLNSGLYQCDILAWATAIQHSLPRMTVDDIFNAKVFI